MSRKLVIWSLEDDALLEELYYSIENYTYEQIAQKIGHTTGSVGSRITKLGITKNKKATSDDRGITLHPQPGVTVHYASYRYK